VTVFPWLGSLTRFFANLLGRTNQRVAYTLNLIGELYAKQGKFGNDEYVICLEFMAVDKSLYLTGLLLLLLLLFFKFSSWFSFVVVFLLAGPIDTLSVLWKWIVNCLATSIQKLRRIYLGTLFLISFLFCFLTRIV
jgi:hypothetical protein